MNEEKDACDVHENACVDPKDNKIKTPKPKIIKKEI